MLHYRNILGMASIVILLAMAHPVALAAGKEPGGIPEITMNMQMMNTTTKQVVANIKQSGNMTNLMNAQKAMSYQILNAAGIQPNNLKPEDKKELDTHHTNNFQAFISYAVSVGLASEGRYAEAQMAARQAVSLDPSFKEAVRQSYAIPSTKATLQQIQQASLNQSNIRANSMMSGNVPFVPNRSGVPASVGGGQPGGGKPGEKPAQPPAAKPDGKPAGNPADMVKNAVDKVFKTNQVMSKLAENVKNNPKDAAVLMEKTISGEKLSPDLALMITLDKMETKDAKTINNMISVASKHGLTNDKMVFVTNSILADKGGCK
ncbi:MAG: hypothetical protein HQL55_18485 [Magnetococcales bacterium]|nr:hypothetical protein [Magnetococcales bacterium]